MDQFEAYFQRADTDRDGRISGNEALAFFRATDLPNQVLAQIWTYADKNQANFLGRQEFYNALKLVTVAQSKRELTEDLVKAALYGPASSQIPPPKINIAAIAGPSNITPSPSPMQQTGTGTIPSTPSVRPPQQNQFARPPLPYQVPSRNLSSAATTQGGFGPVVPLATQEKKPVVSYVWSQPSSSKLNNTTSLSTHVEKEEPRPAVNGFASPSQPKQNFTAPQDSAVRPPAGHPGLAPSQPPWPRMTQSDIQRYTEVFAKVDIDRDGKITGPEARNLFLHWGLPREVLKQVWDLSDQDKDSMLSLREFCTALYLMERHREGRTLPAVLPNSVIFEGTPLPAPVVHNASWRPPSGLQVQQPQGPRNAPRPGANVAAGRPPRPVSIPQPDEPIQQKPRVPVLEKNLVDQLSTEEQDSLNKKFQEAKDAEKKVADLEKDISEAKQKIQFYHGKMQELILYKSQCDNRLNEITEKVVSDKREAESLAKKYEEKYKQSGDVASKLTIEEATFRDIQEKKMELYRAIVKLEHEKADGIQDRTNQIQSELEELVKALNERCKTYGLRGKPTSLVELPFGWQVGISGTAADWDENWDKFEDEGFTLVKELTLDVENIIAPPIPKTPLIREKVASTDISGAVKSPYKADDDNSGQLNSDDNGQTARSPPDSPARSNTVESPSKEIQELQAMKGFTLNSSPIFDTQSEFGAESVLSGERSFDEPAWGSFDTHYDADAASDFNPSTPKDADRERRNENSLFGTDDWNLNPIRTGPSGPDSFSKQGPFFDSVPSTPLYNTATSPNADNLFPQQSPFAYDSAPSTPMYNFNTSPKKSAFADSIPSTPMYNFNSSLKKNAFADSVPSTPMYNSSTSPRRFSEGSEENYSFDNFARLDSFNMHDSGPFPANETLTRFDSMRSTRDSYDFDQGYFASNPSLSRFDSFRSTADSDYNFGQPAAPDPFARYDSMRSTRDSDYGFKSFDDSDPFGSSEPFRSSNEAQTPKRDSDVWKAF